MMYILFFYLSLLSSHLVRVLCNEVSMVLYCCMIDESPSVTQRIEEGAPCTVAPIAQLSISMCRALRCEVGSQSFRFTQYIYFRIYVVCFRLHFRRNAPPRNRAHFYPFVKLRHTISNKTQMKDVFSLFI